MRTMTTLVALVGESASQALTHLNASNVSTEPAGELPEDPLASVRPLDAVWRRALRHGSVYTVTDVDPLQPVVEAWAHRLAGEEDRLELMIGLTPDLRAPDYYLIDPALGDPAIHWYADHLSQLSPARVIITQLRPQKILRRLGALPAGPELPGLRSLASDARDYVPTPELERPQPFTTPSGRSLATGAARPASRQASTTSSTSL